MAVNAGGSDGIYTPAPTVLDDATLKGEIVISSIHYR